MKTIQGTSAMAVEWDSECEGAWAAEAVDNEPDWFEVAELDKMATTRKCSDAIIEESPIQDWLYGVAEGKYESKDKEASSIDVCVEEFNLDALGGAAVKEEMVELGTGTCVKTICKDSEIAGPVWPVCDAFEGANKSSDTLFGQCL